MSEVSTGVDNTHLRGRTYEVKVDKGHRPAQIPRDTIVVQYIDADGTGEVTLENVGEFCLHYVKDDLHARLERLMANGNPDGSDLTFNEALERVIVHLEQEVAVGPNPEPTSWMPDPIAAGTL